MPLSPAPTNPVAQSEIRGDSPSRRTKPEEIIKAIRNEKHEIIGYRQEQQDGRVKIRDKHGELVGWTAFGQTRARGGTLVSSEENEGLLYRDLK